MAEILLDLTGKNGLTDSFSGSTDMTVSQPNLNINVQEGEMAEGYFNTFLRKGYLSPITTTSLAITMPEIQIGVLTSVAYDPINDDVYWSGSSNKIYKQTSLIDSSMEIDTTLETNAILNDLIVYEVDTHPALLYTYDFPDNNSGKNKAIFIGYKSLISTDIPVIYKYDPIITGEASKSFTIEVGSAEKLAAMAIRSSFSNATHESVFLSDVFLTLKRPVADEVQSWDMKLSIYSTTYTATADGNIHDVPDTLIASTTLSSSVLENYFKRVQFTFSSPVEVTTSTIAFVLEPVTPADITGDRGVEWLAGDIGAESSINGLYYDGGWYELTLGNTCKFALQVGLSSSQNVISKNEYSITTNLFGVESDNLIGFETASGNISQAINIGSTDSNIVVVSVVVRNGGNEISGMTIGGQAMTQLYNNFSATASRLYVFYKEGAPTGSQTLATTGLTSATKVAVSVSYGIKPGSIEIIQSATLNSQPDSDGDMVPGVSIGARNIGFYIGTITWYEVAGPDYYQAIPNSYPSYATPDAVIQPGTNAQPMRFSRWNSSDPSKTFYGPALRIRQYDNGSYDNTLDGTYNGIIIRVLAEDTTSSEERYWTFKGTRSGKTFIRNASNGFSYIFSDTAIHKFDGSITGGGSGSLTNDIIKFPDYQTITDAVDYRSRFYVLVNQYPIDRTSQATLNTYSGKTGIYVWGRLSTQLGGDDFIELPGAKEGRSIYAAPDGQLRAITIADNGTVELREFGYNDSGGVVFPIIKRLGIGAYPQVTSGIKVAGDKVIWIGNDGNTYCEKDGAVSIIYQIKPSSTTAETQVGNINGGALFYGSGNETADNGYRSNKQAVTFSYNDNTIADPTIVLIEQNNASVSANYQLQETNNYSIAQSFICPSDIKLGSAVFYVRNMSAYAKSVTARLYAHTGTFGVNGIPATDLNEPLAISKAINIDDLSYYVQEETHFLFEGYNQYNLIGGTPYFIALVHDDGRDGTIQASISASGSHAGNMATLQVSSENHWSYSSTGDVIFSLYSPGETSLLTKKIYPFDLKTGSNTVQTPHQGDVFTGVTYIPVTSVLRDVRVYNAPITGSGTDIVATVKLYFNQSSTVGMTKTVTKDEAKRGYVDFHINKPYIHAIQLEIEWNTAEPIGPDMYLPSVAIITHDPSTTKTPDNG